MNSSNSPYQPSLNGMLGNRYLDFTFNYEDKNMYKLLKNFNSSARAGKTLGFRFNQDSVSKEAAACTDVWYKYVSKLITGEYDPDKYLPIINKELKKAGADKIIVEKQKQLDEWVKAQCISQ